MSVVIVSLCCDIVSSNCILYCYTNPDCVCVSFAPGAQSPPGITDLSQVDSTPLGG